MTAKRAAKPRKTPLNARSNPTAMAPATDLAESAVLVMLESPNPAHAAADLDVRRRLIAAEAYSIAKRRGVAPGREFDDWVAAEAVVEARLGRGEAAKRGLVRTDCLAASGTLARQVAPLPERWNTRGGSSKRRVERLGRFRPVRDRHSRDRRRAEWPCGRFSRGNTRLLGAIGARHRTPPATPANFLGWYPRTAGATVPCLPLIHRSSPVMTRTHCRSLRVSILLALGAGLAPAAHAQTPPKAEASGQLEDIVITATKRESRLQETPISVTAVTGEDIQERGLADFTALAMTVPGLSMRSSGPGQTEFEMRGMTSAGGNSSTVGFYFDDTPLTAPASAQNGKVVIDPNLYDLNHVEVLRGPQGTLYGAGSMGGTVKIVPNAPNPAAFDSSAQLTFGDTKGGGFNHAENAMLNLPLAPNAALRIVASESHDSGWIDRIVIADGQFPAPNGAVRGSLLAAPVASDQRKANDTELNAVRATLLWKPTDRLTVTPTFMYQRIFQNGLSLIDSNPGVNATFQPFNEPEPFSDQFTLGTLNLQYRFNAFDLVSTSSYWTRDEHLRQAGSEEIAIALGASPYISQGGFGTLTPTPFEDDKSKQISEEVRLTSTGERDFKWLVGWFYADFRSDWDLFLTQPGALAATGTTDAFTFYQPTKIIQNAFFGELSYQFSPGLRGTVGLRHFYYNSSIVSTVAGYLSSSGSGNFVTARTATRDQGLNPKFDLSYQIDKDLLVYATVAKGFRPGGGNQPIPTSGSLGAVCEAELQQKFNTTGFVAAPASFAPDRVWSYELGEKWRTAGGRVTLNSAAYFEKWNGVQQNIPLGCGFPYTDNAGYAQIHGFEAEISASVAPGLVLSANAGYSHAVFVGDNRETGITSGTAVQDVPEWTSSAGATYRHPIGQNLSLLMRLDNSYVSGHYDATAQINHLPSYDLTNLRVGVEAERWSAALFAKNLFNKAAKFSDVPAINVSVPQFNRIAVSQPLTIGVDFNYHFGR